MRLIDADEIRIKPEYMHDISGSVMIRVEDIARILNDMPTIEIERKKSYSHKCSVCGRIKDFKSNYCPNCGADMRGEEE